MSESQPRKGSPTDPPPITPAIGAEFFRILINSGDPDAAFVSAVGSLIAVGRDRDARAIAQALSQYSGLALASDMCRVLVAAHDPMFETGWELIQRNDINDVLRLIPAAYVRIGLEVDPTATFATMRRVLEGQLVVEGSALTWLGIARTAFVAGADDVAVGALDRARDGLAALAQPQRQRTRGQIVRLRRWLDRRAAASQAVTLARGEIPIAVYDYRNPDDALTSRTSATAAETLAVLGHLARRTGVAIVGDEGLPQLVDDLRDQVPAGRRIAGDTATARLFSVDRDATDCSAVPDGTWLIASGRLPQQLFGLHCRLPLNDRLRPIFIGVHVDCRPLLGEGAVEYLRRYAPIGCQDWNSVYLLQAAGVPAFFSGPLVATLDLVVPVQSTRGVRRLNVDGPNVADDEVWIDPEIANRRLAANVRAVRRLLVRYGERYSKIITGDATCYWAARAIGCGAGLRPARRKEARFDSGFGASAAEFDALRRAASDKIATVLAAVLAGRDEDDVYGTWRAICAADVAEAERRRADLPELAPPSFDVAKACDRVRSEMVTIERSQPAPDGAEINIEFSLDGNLKHEMGIVLESIVSRCSRPVRLFILCREHGPEDFKRMAALFPTVSFVWLPTDHVNYGEILGMLKHITIATMDRLLLPDLLPDVDRIIHHDLDALCCADLAELFDIDLGDRPLAARDQLHPSLGSGYLAFTLRAAGRFRANPERGSELLLRMSRRHPFDVPTFNAGIMVLNLSRMRADRFTRYYLPYAEYFGYNDQEVLNAYCISTRAPLDYSWNAYPKLELTEDAKVLHWLGPLKPWLPRYVGERDRWREADAAFTARAASVE